MRRGREFSLALSQSRQGARRYIRDYLGRRRVGERKGPAMIWGLIAVIVLVAVEFAWGTLREWNARRRAIKRGRTLTAKYGIPWR